MEPLAHAPATQDWPNGQALPQAPQFCESVIVSVHPVGQQVAPKSHATPRLQICGDTHVPATQLCPEAHPFPHAPQFTVSLFVSEQPVVQH
jgi:hypothetical protein